MQSTAQEVNEQAGAALQQIREARQEADVVRFEVGQVRQEVEQARQDATQVRQLADQARFDADQARQALELVRQETPQVRQDVEQIRQEATQARQDLDQVRLDTTRAREDVDLFLPIVYKSREQTEQVQRDLDLVRQQQGEAAQKAQQSLRETEETLDQLEQARQRHDEASRQLEEVRLQLVEARTYLEGLRRECQEASQSLLQEIEQQREQTRKQARQASSDRDQPAPEPRPRREQAKSHRDEVVKAQPAASGTELSATLTTQESVAGAGAEAGQDGKGMIRAAVRPESPQERITRHLHQAWAVKEELAEFLHGLSGEVVDPELRSALDEQRQRTEKQKEELHQRLRALNAEPTSNRGMLQRLVGWIWESWKHEPDDYDRALQNLEKALTAQQAEVTVAQTLSVLAATAGDTETGELAQRQGAEKQRAVERLQQLIRPLAQLAIQLPATAMAAAQQLLAEEEAAETTQVKPAEEVAKP